MTIRATKPRRTALSPLPPDACPLCGGPMRARKGRLTYPVNGEKIAVPGASFLKCAKDGEVVLRLDDARHLRERALGLYRNKYDLLSSDEIRSLRERLHLTQGALARLLRLGNNTLSRWRGRPQRPDRRDGRAASLGPRPPGRTPVPAGARGLKVLRQQRPV